MNILFVCSGNTCRSPMAEGIFREKTKQYGNYCKIRSCGLSAMTGDSAANNAVKVMRDRGIDISSHRASQVNRYLIDESDFIICMSNSHIEALENIANDKLLLLGGGISDPYGGDDTVYSRCADEISMGIDDLLRSDIFFTTEKMSVNDLDEICKIENDCFSEPWSRESFVSQIEKEYSVCFTEKYLGMPIGYTCADNIVGEVYIGNIAVSESMRRRYAAQKLMHRLIGYCVINKCDMLTLEVRVSNIPALNLYGKFGFKVEGKRKDFYKKPTEDAYIMTKRFGGEEV